MSLLQEQDTGFACMQWSEPGLATAYKRDDAGKMTAQKTISIEEFPRYRPDSLGLPELFGKSLSFQKNKAKTNCYGGELQESCRIWALMLCQNRTGAGDQMLVKQEITNALHAFRLLLGAYVQHELFRYREINQLALDIKKENALKN